MEMLLRHPTAGENGAVVSVTAHGGRRIVVSYYRRELGVAVPSLDLCDSCGLSCVSFLSLSLSLSLSISLSLSLSASFCCRLLSIPRHLYARPLLRLFLPRRPHQATPVLHVKNGQIKL